MQISGKRFEWGCVMSVVPQGIVLDPLVFIVYINDYYTGFSSDVSKLADNTKIIRVIESHQDTNILQDELNTLNDQVRKQQMEFSVRQCTIPFIDRNNPSCSYCLNDTPITRSRGDRYLGVLMCFNLHPRAQCI